MRRSARRRVPGCRNRSPELDVLGLSEKSELLIDRERCYMGGTFHIPERGPHYDGRTGHGRKEEADHQGQYFLVAIVKGVKA